MITFDTNTYLEGNATSMIKDSLKSAANIDIDKIKSNWSNDLKNTGENIKLINDEGLGPAADTADRLNKKLKNSGHYNKNPSIIARARNSVLQFPIYVTQTIRVNEAHIIAKLFERVYTTLVQTVLSQNPIINEDEANNLVFLKQFHTNIKEAADILTNYYYQPIDELDKILGESVFFSQKLTEYCTVEFKAVPPINQDLIMENNRLLNDPLSGFIYLREASGQKGDTEVSEERQNEYITVSEDELRTMAINREGIDNNRVRLAGMSNKNIRDDVENEMHGADPADINDEVRDRINERDFARDDIDKAIEKLKDDIKNGNIKNYEYNNGRYYRMNIKGKSVVRPKKKEKPDIISAVDAPKLLKDADIKKINGMLPYTIEATFRIRSKNGGLERDVRFIIGIKSVMHLIRTQDLSEDLHEIVTGNIKKLQKVRYKTGEIGLMDYLFNKKGIKADAAKHINYNKRWLNTLKRLGEYQKMNSTLLKKPIKAITGGNVPIPNGTLILAQPDITTLTNQTGIDLSLVSNAKRLAKSLFLIAIAIVDSSAGTMRVIFPDSDDDWDVQSLASIDAELSKTDNSQIMRELNKMVNR